MNCCEKSSGNFCATCGKPLANLDTLLKHLRLMEKNHKARLQWLHKNKHEGDKRRETKRLARVKSAEKFVSKWTSWANQLEELLKGREA